MKGQIRIVLCQPTSPGNIGGAARALKTMGLQNLVLVDPLMGADHVDAVSRACGSTDVLARARTVGTLAEAVSDCVWVVGLSARTRNAGPGPIDISDAAVQTMQRAASGPVAWVFGTERAGLTNDELLCCQQQARIPTDEALSSLNLAAAVQVASYELHRASLAPASLAPGEPPAPRVQVQAFVDRLNNALVSVGRFDPEAPKLVLIQHRFLRVLNRIEPTSQELKAMHAMLKWLGH